MSRYPGSRKARDRNRTAYSRKHEAQPGVLTGGLDSSLAATIGGRSACGTGAGK